DFALEPELKVLGPEVEFAGLLVEVPSVSEIDVAQTAFGGGFTERVERCRRFIRGCVRGAGRGGEGEQFPADVLIHVTAVIGDGGEQQMLLAFEAVDGQARDVQPSAEPYVG